MLSVLTLSKTNQTKWDTIVQQFPQHDYYYLSAYLQATGLPNQQAVLFHYTDQTFSAVHVSWRQDLAFTENLAGKITPRRAYRLTSGAGYGGFLFSGQPTLRQLAELERAYQTACLELNIVVEQVRFNPTQFNQTSNQFMYHLNQSTNAVAMDLTNSTRFDSSLHPQFHQELQQTLQAGVQISMANDGQALEALYQLGQATTLNGPAHCSRQLLGTFNRHLAGHFQVLLASYQDQVIAGGLVMSTNQQLSGQFFGHQQHRLGVRAENLLYYTAAEWGHEMGDHTFFLGGGSAGQINQQLTLNNTKVPVAILSTGEKIFDQAAFNQLSQFSAAASSLTGRAPQLHTAI